MVATRGTIAAAHCCRGRVLLSKLAPLASQTILVVTARSISTSSLPQCIHPSSSESVRLAVRQRCLASLPCHFHSQNSLPTLADRAKGDGGPPVEDVRKSFSANERCGGGEGDFSQDDIGLKPPSPGPAMGSGEEEGERPWYLEVDVPKHPTHLFEPAPLPDVPPDSPPILSILLAYASEELGFDELSILDLREMYPPPALGPNLIMMFGTARSERHLHVSAGRVVRWLRSQHNIIAHADGRLGRNQMKLRLKRKRKREALLGARGVIPRNEDDGIKTGWVCVNLGSVGPKRGKTVKIFDLDGKLAGFGDENAGLQTTLVFQMFTEAQRHDMDLESLWKKHLEQSRRRMEELRAIASGFVVPSSPNGTAHGRQGPSTTVAYQRRFFSHGVSNRRTVRETPRNDEFSLLVTKPNISSSDKARLYQYLLDDPRAKLRTLYQLRRYIDRLPSEDQRHYLHQSVDDDSRGGFVHLSNIAQKSLPSQDTFEHRKWLYEKAREHQLPGYPFRIIQELVDEFCISGVELPTRSSLVNLLRAAAWPVPDTPLSSNVDLVLKVLQNAHERAPVKQLITSDVVVALIEAFYMHTKPDTTTQVEQVQRSLYNLLLVSGARCPNPEELLKLLSMCAEQGDWPQFWRVWGLPPLYNLPRTASLYMFVFHTLAETKHQLNCQMALRTCVEEMVMERPRIDLGSHPTLVETLKSCVRVADPAAEEVLVEVKNAVMERGDKLSQDLRRKARGEFVVLMAQIYNRKLTDTRGPNRQINQIGPSFNMPLRSRSLARRQARERLRASARMSQFYRRP